VLIAVLAAVQLALVPALPAFLQADLLLLGGLLLLAGGRAETAAIYLFGAGLCMDAFASPRLGLCTLGYLAAAYALWNLERDFVRGRALGAWLAGMLGTLIAYFVVALLGWLTGAFETFSEGLALALQRGIAALVLGMPLALAVEWASARLGLLSAGAREARAGR
jgi:hypothetical protein